MLNDAQQRNDVLNQAYAVLHAEYVSLKTNQIKDQPYHHQQPEFTYSSSQHSIHDLSTAPDALDMELYVYPDMNVGYPL